jgi:hypothetical protein
LLLIVLVDGGLLEEELKPDLLGEESASPASMRSSFREKKGVWFNSG